MPCVQCSNMIKHRQGFCHVTRAATEDSSWAAANSAEGSSCMHNLTFNMAAKIVHSLLLDPTGKVPAASGPDMTQTQYRNKMQPFVTAYAFGSKLERGHVHAGTGLEHRGGYIAGRSAQTPVKAQLAFVQAVLPA